MPVLLEYLPKQVTRTNRCSALGPKTASWVAAQLADLALSMDPNLFDGRVGVGCGVGDLDPGSHPPGRRMWVVRL